MSGRRMSQSRREQTESNTVSALFTVAMKKPCVQKLAGDEGLNWLTAY